MNARVRGRVRAFLSGYAGGRHFTDRTSIFEEGLVNSLFALQLILFVERDFDLTIADDDLELANFASVEKIAAFVCGKVAVLPRHGTEAWRS